MERFTKRAENGNVFYPHCFEECQGMAETEKCISCDYYDRLLKRFAEYEDAEEQGLLLRLPCKVGDTVYSVVKDGLQIFELKFSLDFYVRRMSDFGKTVFLTQEEAEQELKQMKGE